MFARIGLLVGVAAALYALYTAGFFEFARDAQRVREAITGLGPLAPVLYVAAFSLLEPFFVPGLLFIVAGALVWSFPTLFALSWLGSVGAGIVGFGFARFIGRDFVARRLPPKLHAYDQSLVDRGLRTVILVRLTLFLAPPAHWLLGLSRVRFSTFLLGTAIGFVPGIAVATYFVVVLGESFGDWLAAQPKQTWLAVGGVVALALIVHRRWTARRERLAPDLADEAEGSASDP